MKLMMEYIEFNTLDFNIPAHHESIEDFVPALVSHGPYRIERECIAFVNSRHQKLAQTTSSRFVARQRNESYRTTGEIICFLVLWSTPFDDLSFYV